VREINSLNSTSENFLISSHTHFDVQQDAFIGLWDRLHSHCQGS
jgi:hypothetical protein